MSFQLRSLRTAATVLAFASLAACSSKKDDATPAPTQGMSWTVDGSNVTASSAVGVASGTEVTVAGATGNTGGVFLDVPKTVGTYTISSTSAAGANYVVTPSSGGSQSYDATSGSIVVTSVSANNIVGTFTFTGAGSGSTSKTLTNGKFNANF